MSSLLICGVVRLRAMSNFTDFEPLALEPGVSVRFTDAAADIEGADLAILPGSKSTVADLAALMWSPGEFSFAAARERQADRLAALISDHADTEGLLALAESGPPRDLPVIPPAGVG